LVTPTGADFDYPKMTVHGIGTQVSGQGTAFGGSDPSFDKVSFSAFKYGQLVQVAAEVIEDSGIDIVDFILRNSARALGRVIDTDLVLGTGTNEPFGIMAAGAVGAAGTVATGGTAIYPTYEKLIDFQYSVNDSYRSSGNAAWLFSDTTAANLRKLRDGAGGTVGAPLWQSSTTAGIAGVRQPPALLGDPAFVDANVASIGTVAKLIAAYGDWSAYVVRLVHDVILERDDSYAFDKDMVTFRAKLRVDGRLLDSTAINRLNAAPA
jgi:HK97 family phage major capsid protein